MTFADRLQLDELRTKYTRIYNDMFSNPDTYLDKKMQCERIKSEIDAIYYRASRR